MVNNKDNKVFLSQNYRSDSCPWKFDVLKTSIFAHRGVRTQFLSGAYSVLNSVKIWIQSAIRGKKS